MQTSTHQHSRMHFNRVFHILGPAAEQKRVAVRNAHFKGFKQPLQLSRAQNSISSQILYWFIALTVFSVYSSAAAARGGDGPDRQRAPMHKQRPTVGAARQTDCVFLSRPAPLLSHTQVLPDCFLVHHSRGYIYSLPMLEIRFIFTTSLFLLAMKC